MANQARSKRDLLLNLGARLSSGFRKRQGIYGKEDLNNKDTRRSEEGRKGGIKLLISRGKLLKVQESLESLEKGEKMEKRILRILSAELIQTRQPLTRQRNRRYGRQQ